MLPAQTAISRARRGITLGLVVRGLLWLAAIASVASAPLLKGGPDFRLALLVVGAVWVMLAMRSARLDRLNADLPQLLAGGHFDAAEQQIDRTLRAFSLFRPGKLQALHQLSVLRMAQGRFDDVAVICRELLSHRLAGLAGVSRSTGLMLAQASLEIGDLASAGAAIATVRQGQPSLAELMQLLVLELDYQSRQSHWQAMLDGFMSKAQLAEVMPSGPSARVQGLLALAAMKCGRDDVALWLRRRAELLADPADLVSRQPALAEVWPECRRESKPTGDTGHPPVES